VDSLAAKINSRIVRQALAKRSWSALGQHLQDIELDDAGVAKLLAWVLQCEEFVLKRPDAKASTDRDTLLGELAGLLDARDDPDAASTVRSYIALFRQIDEGYAGVLAGLQDCDAARWTPTKRVSALIRYTARESFEFLQGLEALASSGELRVDQNVFRDPDGVEFVGHARHGASTEALGSALFMEAHASLWFAEDGCIVLPEFPATRREEELAAREIQLHALYWRNWQRMERRRRFLGGSLEVAEERPPRAGGSATVVLSHPTVAERHDFVANERLYARLNQELVRMLSHEAARKDAAGIDGPVDLLPVAAVSVVESHGACVLAQLLSVDVERDPAEFGGLRLVEWLRGYAFRQRLSEQQRDGADPYRQCLLVARGELEERLTSLGLTREKSRLFVRHATLRRTSRDILDQPLVQLADGRLLLLGMAAEHMSLPRIILSVLSGLNADLSARGNAFHARILKLLAEFGFAARNIKCRRGREEYDYDVAFVWGDYLFLLECKSHGLSGNEAIAAHHFLREVEQSVHQVRRLVDALGRHPDILEEHLPEAVGKTVVPCVIHSLPYSIPGGLGGVLFTDESSVARFFRHPFIGEASIDRMSGRLVMAPDDIVTSLWARSKPSPEDFIRSLVAPVQHALIEGHTELNPTFALLGQHLTGVHFEFSLADMSKESMRRVLAERGFPVTAP
jgi:hypothetical protein